MERAGSVQSPQEWRTSRMCGREWVAELESRENAGRREPCPVNRGGSVRRDREGEGRAKGLMQRSRIITHMAGNTYFTLIKSVFFFARLSETPLPTFLDPLSAPIILFSTLTSLASASAIQRWVGNWLLSFPWDVLIILNSPASV